MSVTYYTYLYLGIKLKEFLEIDSKEDFYFKFDPKTGQPTNEKVVEKTIYTLKFGDRTTTQEVEGTGGLRYYEETYEDLLGISYRDKDGLSIFMDYNKPEESVAGFILSRVGEYSNEGKSSYTLSEIQEKSEELKQIVKDRMGLDIEPEIISLSYISY